MATENIQIAVEFTGADAAASGADKVSAAVKKLATEQEKTARAGAEFAGKIAAASGVVARLAASVGGETTAKLATFTASLAQSAQAGAQLGLAFGPTGALVGGIVGFAIPALTELTTAFTQADRASSDFRRSMDEAGRSARSAMLDQRRQADAQAGVFGSDSSDRDLTSHIDTAQATIAELEQQRAALRDQSLVAGARSALSGERSSEGAIARLTTEIEAQQRVIDLVGVEIERRHALTVQERDEADERQRARREDDTVARMQEEADAQTEIADGMRRLGEQQAAADRQLESQRQQAAARQRERDRIALAAMNEQLDKMREIAALERRLAEESKALHERALEVEIEEYERLGEIMTANADLAIRAAEAEAEAARETNDQRRAYNDELMEQNRRNEAAAKAQVAMYEETTSVIANGLTDALVAIIAGQKSAAEAFKGLLASFLAYISQQAALKAAFEFAEAIASFASFNFASGAMHVGAGLAYTAVAVATGVGAALLAPPPAAGPQAGAASKDKDGGKGGDVVINWNSPVVTAQTRAELGRDIRGLVVAAGSRGI